MYEFLKRNLCELLRRVIVPRKNIRALVLILIISYVSSAACADTIINGDLKIHGSGSLVLSDGSVQSKAQVAGPKGDARATGPANVLTIGSVTTGSSGSAASAAITGIAPSQS
jgi:hypothetical protein